MKGSLFAVLMLPNTTEEKKKATIFTFYGNQVTEFRRGDVLGVDWFVQMFFPYSSSRH